MNKFSPLFIGGIGMAGKRMFSTKITDSDAFIEIPSSAQALYFHLNQGADDDGFNNQIQNAMFKAHASTDDLKILMAKNFIIRFESGVIVIKHWRMHNTLRKDRYTPTNFQEELHQLGIKDNGSYTFSEQGTNLVAKWLPNGCRSIDKNSIDKNSIDKVNIYSENEKPKKIKEEKIHFAEFVSMTNANYEKLVNTYGKDFADQCITTLDNYKGSKGKTYKDDYRAILSWVVKRVQEDGFKPNPNEKNQEEQKEISYSCDIFTDQEYAQIMKGKMSKEEQLRIVKERTGEENV